MTINYNVTGTERKRLADYIFGFMGTEKKYLGAPTFAYQIGYITVSKDAAKPEEAAATEEPAADTSGCGLTISMSAASFTADGLNNLHSLIAAKGRLLRAALGIDLLPVQVEAVTVSFPWFEGIELETGEIQAYTHLISALCDMARNQKRITTWEKATDNDKYAFRCFLLRLNFIGSEYKEERKILLRNLSGNSAFKSGRRKAESEILQLEPPTPASRMDVQGDRELAEALADELLIQQVNASFREEAAS